MISDTKLMYGGVKLPPCMIEDEDKELLAIRFLELGYEVARICREYGITHINLTEGHLRRSNEETVLLLFASVFGCVPNDAVRYMDTFLGFSLQGLACSLPQYWGNSLGHACWEHGHAWRIKDNHIRRTLDKCTPTVFPSVCIVDKCRDVSQRMQGVKKLETYFINDLMGDLRMG